MHASGSTTAEFEPPKALLDLMSEQVDVQRNESIATAQAEAAAIRDAARRRAESRREAALREVEAELSTEAQRSRERAEAEAQMVELTTKDRITDEILSAARAELDRIAESDAFKAVVEDLLAEVMSEAPEDPIVLAPVKHEETVRAWLQSHGHGSVAVETLATLKDGVAVQDARRTFRVTNTLSARFNRQEGALRKLCLRRLQPGEE